MQVKTYRASDLAAALAAARQEMGPDARVLETRRVGGSLGLDGVELIVAVDRKSAERPAIRSELQRLSREVLRIQQRKSQSQTDSVSGVHRRKAVAESYRAARPTSDPVETSFLAGATRRLVDSGLSQDLATRFERIARQELLDPLSPQSMAVATSRGMESLLPFRPWQDRDGVLFVVGSPGAGKTTSAAKLAAKCCLDSDRPVVFVQADQQRVGATEQARIYANSIGFEMKIADGAAELRALLATGDPRTLWVVDTCGVGPADTNRLDAVRRLRAAAPSGEVALLIPAGSHPTEVRALIRRFEPVHPTCAALSKVDGAQRLGELVNELEPFGLPLSFTTHGHEVPDDLEPATPGRLAKWLLQPSEIHA